MEFHDAWFFIGIFVFIFLIWIASGGPLHPIAFTGPTLAEPGALGGGTYLQLPRARYGVGSSNVSLPGSSNGESVSDNGNSSAPLPTFTGGSLFGEPSPYRGIVSMTHYVSGAGSQDPGNEYLEIDVAQNAGVPVDLSEWSLESDASGNAIVIPKGTEVPTSGIVNAAQDIVLAPGERALVISGQSPIGASFRENKCIGYFSTFQKFSPPLPQNCPIPSDELSSYYGAGYIRDAACIDYVNSLSRCQVALTPPPGVTSACQSFLVKYLNYNGCVDAHRSDSDFAGDTWRIYLGRTNSMWRTKNELVKLLDINGKTVDAFSY
ncbi:MAG: hypothetical protein ACYC6X_02035 [Minisyncoccota bacterium]